MYELTISLRPKSGTPLYEQIYDHIKGEIQDGHIKSGEKLPSTRALCRHLEVSRSTVELAYEQLLSEGYVEAEPCRGYFVSQIEGLYHFERQERKRPEGKQEPEKSYLYDFTPNGVAFLTTHGESFQESVLPMTGLNCSAWEIPRENTV